MGEVLGLLGDSIASALVPLINIEVYLIGLAAVSSQNHIWFLAAVGGEPFGDQPDQIAIGVTAQHLEARQAALAEARPVVLQSASLGLADGCLLIFPVI